MNALRIVTVLPLCIATETDDPVCLGRNATTGNRPSQILIPPYKFALLAFGDTTTCRERYFCVMLYCSFTRLLIRGTDRARALLIPCAVPLKISPGESCLRNSCWIRSISPRFSCVICIFMAKHYFCDLSAAGTMLSGRSYSCNLRSIFRYKSTGCGVRRFKSSYQRRDTPASRHNRDMDILAALARRRMSFAKSSFICSIIIEYYKSSKSVF